MEKKYIKINAIIQHPNIDEMKSYTNSKIEDDLQFAIKKYNITNDSKYKIISYNFDTNNRWVFEFVFEVPADYKYTFHIMRVLSRALYHDKEWKVLSNVETRLFTVISHEEIELPSTVRQFDVEKSYTNNKSITSNDDIAVAKITIEVIGKENIIELINNLLKHGKLKGD